MTRELTQRPQHVGSRSPVLDDRMKDADDPAEHRANVDHDRLWSAAGNPNQGNALPASKPADVVNTQWWVDYQSVAGKSRKLPDRYGDDQMVVDQLKIRPNGAPSTILRGGNMARSGDVFLGTASVPKGPGTVTAAVRYAKKSAFDVKVELEPAASQTERTALAAASREAKAMVMDMIEDRGDYDAIAAEVQAQLSDRFPDKTLKVSIKPLATGKATEQFTADGADYSVSGDSKFAVLVEPTGSKEHATTWNRGEASEDGAAESDQAAVKTTSDVATRTKETEKEKIVSSFKSTLATNVQHIFKQIEEQIDSSTGQHTATHDKSVKWTVGVDPAKEKKEGDKPEASGGGVLDKLKKVVTSGGKWLYRKGKNLVKRIPLVAAGLELVGSLWDTITGRGKVSRESTESDGTSDTKGSSTTHKDGIEISSLSTIASELTQTMIKETEHDVEKEIATRLGTEVSSVKKTDATKKKAVNSSASGTTITYEVGRPQVVIKKLD